MMLIGRYEMAHQSLSDMPTGSLEDLFRRRNSLQESLNQLEAQKHSVQEIINAGTLFLQSSKVG